MANFAARGWLSRNLDRRGVWSVGAARGNRLEERQELIARPHHETVVRDADDVGERSAWQHEADGYAAGTNAGIVVPIGGHSRRIGESDDDRHRRPTEMRRLAQR